MKGLAILAFLFVLGGGGLMLASFVTNGKSGLLVTLTNRKNSRMGWRVAPRTLESGAREVRLVCPGEPDFIFAPAREYTNETGWENALFNAEVQANEFNRLRKQGLREITR